jgi:hypothetical protein
VSALSGFVCFSRPIHRLLDALSHVQDESPELDFNFSREITQVYDDNIRFIGSKGALHEPAPEESSIRQYLIDLLLLWSVLAAPSSRSQQQSHYYMLS